MTKPYALCEARGCSDNALHTMRASTATWTSGEMKLCSAHASQEVSSYIDTEVIILLTCNVFMETD